MKTVKEIMFKTGVLLEKLSELLDVFTRTLAGMILAGLSIITLAGVFWRFVLNNPVVWIYETSIVSFSWLIFLGAAMAFKRRDHIRIEFIINKLPLKYRFIWELMIDSIILFVLFIGVKDSVGIVQGTWGQDFNTIPIPKGLYYLSFPVSMVVAMVHVLTRMITLDTKKISEEPTQDTLGVV